MKELIDYYQQFDEWGRLDREPIEYKVNWHYIKKYLPSSGHILDNGAGPGKYSMALAKEGFHVTLSDLTPNTTYYVRSYATNNVGTAYGNEISFKTSEQNEDGEGNEGG